MPYRSAGSPDLKITFGKMAVKPFYPRGETIILMNARQTVNLNGQTTENP